MSPLSVDLTPELASRFARIALGHVTREYPHKADHVMDGPQDVYTPRAVHPIFFGSFDWHSCVHGHWLLVRLRRLFPEIVEATAITELMDTQFMAEKVEAERAYLDRPSSRGFERPYGWAWLLKLAAELALDPSPDAARWRDTLHPLTDAFVQRFMDFLPRQTYPIRVGTHFNSAFALVLATDYAKTTGNETLLAQLSTSAAAWYSEDIATQAWEPGGDDFLSPTLVIAQAQLRLLPPEAFAVWFAACLPELKSGQPKTLFTPAIVSDRTDGKIAHLDGVNLSRAWAWYELAAHVPDEIRQTVLDAAARHLDASLPHVAGDYLGEHWLATYALLAIEARHRSGDAERD